MNEVNLDQANSRVRNIMYQALLGSGQIGPGGPVSPGNIPSHLLLPGPQYSSNLHTSPYLAAAYYNQFANNPPNFVVPTSPAAHGPFFAYGHSQIHPSLAPNSPNESASQNLHLSHPNSLASLHPRSPSSPKELSRSEQKSAFTSSGKRKAEIVTNSGMSSIMRNRLTRPPDIAIHDHHNSFREQVPLSAPPTQTQFKEMSIQHWIGNSRNVTGDLAAPIATPLSAPPIPDDERGDRHFNYPRFSSSFARSSDENIERTSIDAKSSGIAAARTARKTSSLESESMDGIVTKSDHGSPTTSGSSVTPPTVQAAINGSQLSSTNGLCCYRKGSVIQLADNSLKNIEDMKTQDFLSCVASSPDLVLDSSTIIEIEMRNSITAHITFSVGKRAMKSKVEVPLDHPFFVYHSGWSSCSPDRTKKVHQLETRLLSVGDQCITLSRRAGESCVNRVGPNSRNHRNELIAHRVDSHNTHNNNNYSSKPSVNHHDQREDDEEEEYSSLPMNLKKNKSNEMDVDENQNNMKQTPEASFDGNKHINDIPMN